MRGVLLIITLFTCAFAEAQVNSVRNPSFEDHTQCPSQTDQIDFSNYWSGLDSPVNHNCTPEYCNSCASTNPWSVPFGARYYQYPRTGNAFAHVYVYYDETILPQPYRRDYLQGRLHSELIDGQSYCVALYVCMTEESRYAIDKIGAYLDDGSIDTINNCGMPLTQFVPQIQNTAGVIDDTMHWIKIEGSFTANGSEKCITIGNFYDLSNTNSIIQPNNSYNFINDNFGYYLVDDVSVIPSDLPAYAGPDVWVALGDSIFIGRPPEVGLECKWYVGGNVVDSGGGIWVHPTVTTTYVVEQTLCGLVKTDTVTVSVFPVGVNGMTNSRQLSVYPNPASTEVTVYCERSVFSQCTIVNGLGQAVATHLLADPETRIDIRALLAGVYYLQLYGDKGREVRSFVKY